MNNFFCVQKFFVFAVLFLSILFYSCSNSSSNLQDEYITLQSTAENFLESTDWTDEIEGNILTQVVENKFNYEKTIKVSPEVISVCMEDNKPLYPSVNDFSSLDLSLFTLQQKNTVEEFCQCIVDGKAAENFMANSHVYALTLFLYDVQDITGMNYFASGDEEKIFTGFLIGEPFVNENLVECPVRFFYTNGYEEDNYSSPSLDVLLFLSKNSSEWKILQFEFL